MKCWHYDYSGLSVASDLHIPEWRLFEGRTSRPVYQVRIRLQAAAEREGESLESFINDQD